MKRRNLLHASCTTLMTSMPDVATSLMAEVNFGVVLTDGIHKSAVSSSQGTQATIHRTTIATQCTLEFLTTAGCQTEEMFRGKKYLEVDHEFLLKWMKHEAEMQRRENAIESRRLALEESRLEWYKQCMLLEQQARDEERRRQLECEEEERRARAEERRTYTAHQQAVLSILEGILSRLNQ
ncbi:uncharacterized protein LOC144158902 isoform X3 [Haemaphysalis longicornis]